MKLKFINKFPGISRGGVPLTIGKMWFLTENVYKKHFSKSELLGQIFPYLKGIYEIYLCRF